MSSTTNYSGQIVPPAEAVQPSPVQAPPVQDSIIVARNLAKEFNGKLVVKDVTFDVPRGSIFGFIGPSGSGKTTTIRMLTGSYKPTSGDVTVFGRNPLRFSQREAAQIGYMPQLFILYPNLTVWENLNFAASIFGMGLFRGRAMREVLEFVELDKHQGKLARDISGGMLRRLSLAATLIHNPSLLYLDEPTAGIDPVLRRKFWDRFAALKDAGRTIFITTQYVAEADNCDLVGVIGKGRLITVDTPMGLRHHVYGGDMVDFRTMQPFDYNREALMRELPFVRTITARMDFNSVRVVVDDAGTAIPELIKWAEQQDIQVKAVEDYTPSLEDVFVELMRTQSEESEEE